MMICSLCNKDQSIDQFYKRKNGNYRKDCKECVKHRTKTYIKNNIDKKRNYDREYRKNNFDIIKIKKSKYYVENKDHFSKKAKERYTRVDKEQLKNKRKIYRDYKFKNDILFKLKHNIGRMFRSKFKNLGYKKSKTSDQILGCSILEFRQYIESKFEPWMNWENHGLYNGEFNYGWDIDHIIPISSAKSIDDVIRLNHFTNLQPLCSYVNRVIKKDKL